MPVVDLALAGEARGFRSLYLPEHTHRPVASADRLPEHYQRVLDPYIASAWVSATTSLEVGTGVSLVAHHDAVALAKAIATLDHLSGGRVVIGVGFGSGREESVAHGVAASERAVVVEETVRLMKALWTDDQACFEGRYRSLPPSWAWPKPVRRGGPPILLGAREGVRNFERIAAWADGWLPVGAEVGDAAFSAALHDLRLRWQDAGRVGKPEVCLFFAVGSRDAMRRQICWGAELGIQRMQVLLGDRGRDDVLPILDELAMAMSNQEG